MTFSPWGLYAHLLESRDAFRIRAVRGGRAGTPSSPYFYIARKVHMRFKVRSLGGKLIFITALTLLLCMILFSALSWGLLKFLSEREARSDATTHLSLLKKNYQSQTSRLILDLQQVAQNTDITSTVSQPSTPSTRTRLQTSLALFPTQYHIFLAELDIFNKNHRLVGQLADGENTSYLNSPTTNTLIDQALQKKEISALQVSRPSSHSPLVLSIAVPILDRKNTAKAVQLLIAMGIFVFALGVFTYAFITRYFYLRPLRRLQARMRSLVANASTEVSSPANDELSMLVSSFNLLSNSLYVKESESVAMTMQMRDLLIMSDALISTLNLEHLLGEIVSRLGSIMQVKNVSLHLYGREMISPWAVAHWADQAQGSDPLLPASPTLPQQGAVTVHADPDGDITLAATSKMAVIPGLRPGNSHGKRNARGTKKRGQP